MEAYLGQKVYGIPGIGITLEGIDNNSWCTSVTTDRSQRRTQVIEKEKPYFSLFRNAEGYDNLKNCQNAYEHYDVLTFHRKPSQKTDNMQFGFIVDNTGNKRNEHALVHIYSTQHRQMAFDGFAVSPGKKNLLQRFQDRNKAFCLGQSSIKFSPPKQYLTERDFDRYKSEDVCAFIIYVTQAKKQHKSSYVEMEADDGWEYDGVSATTDGVGGGGGGLDQYHYTNLMEGRRTNQTFTQIDLKYTSAPIHVYNVVIILKTDYHI